MALDRDSNNNNNNAGAHVRNSNSRLDIHTIFCCTQTPTSWFWLCWYDRWRCVCTLLYQIAVLHKPTNITESMSEQNKHTQHSEWRENNNAISRCLYVFRVKCWIHCCLSATMWLTMAFDYFIDIAVCQHVAFSWMKCLVSNIVGTINVVKINIRKISSHQISSHQIH